MAESTPHDEPNRPVRWRRLLLHLIGPAVFVYLLSRIDLGNVLEALKRTHLTAYSIACAMPFLLLFLKAVRWRVLVNASAAERVSVGRIYAYSLAGLFLGAATPGRLGELCKIGYARKHGLDLGAATATVLADRIVDVFVLLMLAAVLGADYMRFFGGGLRLAWLLSWGPLLIVLGCFAAVLLSVRFRAAAGFVSKVLGKRLGEAAADGLDAFFHSLRRVAPTGWAGVLFLTVLAWLVYCVQKVTIAVAIGLAINPLYLSAVCLIAAVLAMLPISVLGLGTRDATYVYLLAYAGVSSEQAIALSTLVLFSMILTSAAGCTAFMVLGRASQNKGASCDATSS